MRQKGFTLIEIMVVVVIIGLLATLILPRVLGRQDEAFVAIRDGSFDFHSVGMSLKKHSASLRSAARKI